MLLLQLQEGEHQLVLGKRLQDVILYAQLEGCPRIFKFIMACNQYDAYFGILLFQPPGQLQTIHERHGNVNQGNVHRVIGTKLQCFHTVFGFDGNFKAQCVPIQYTAQVIPKNNLIIHNHHCLHTIFS
ncbi:hypothetical protein D3C75_1097910 [compost metagenome]